MTDFDDDLVATPTIAADGKSLVFSKLFDLYRWSPQADTSAEKIKIEITDTGVQSDIYRRTLTSATDATFSKDGLEIALISGGDLWVMETELKEPVRITDTAEFESDPIFIDEGNAIIFVGWKDGQPDIWKVEREDPSLYWWQSEKFKLTQITDDAAKESDLRLSPNERELVYTVAEIYVCWKWSQERLEHWSILLVPSFDISPDGKWIVYAETDNNFNSDIWIAPVDQKTEPVIFRQPMAI